MTLATTVGPLAAYAISFQTILYISLPRPYRTSVAPLLTGLVGALVAVVAGAVFGFERLGLVGGEVGVAIAWAVGTVLAVSGIAAMMLRRAEFRSHLADPRLASLTTRQAALRVFVRIPIFTALIEEAVFRGVLHSALIALYPESAAVWLGAALFGLWHVGPGIDQAQAVDKGFSSGVLHTIITVALMTCAGAFLVWLRIETGSIWGPVAVHAATNMTMALFARRAAAVASIA